jgi:putative ABC transport system permease protein
VFARSLQPALAGQVAHASGGSRSTGMLADDSVWLSPLAARDLDLAPGERLVVQAGLSDVSLRVAGLLPATQYRRPVGVVDIATAQWRFGRLGRLDRVDLRLQPGWTVAAARARLAAVLPPGAEIKTPDDSGDDAVRLTRAYRSNLTALALVALFTGGFLVYATQSLAVAKPTREITLLRARTDATRAGDASADRRCVHRHRRFDAGGYSGLSRRAQVSRRARTWAPATRGMVPPHLYVHPAECLVFVVLGITAATAASIGPAREAAGVPPQRKR